MAASYKAFGRIFLIKTCGIEQNLLAMADLTGINRAAFINTKLAEHFGVKPIHQSVEGNKLLSPEEEAQMQSLRAQYILQSAEGGFSPEMSSTDDLLAIIQRCKVEVDRRNAYSDLKQMGVA